MLLRLFIGTLFSERYTRELVGSWLDITERKRTEETLAESEERYRTLAESSQDSIYIIDREMRVQYVNHFGAELLGVNSEEIVGECLEKFFDKDTYHRLEVTLQAVIETGTPMSEIRLIRFQNREVWQDTRLVPIRGLQDEVSAVMGVSRDVTEEKRAEQALRDSEARFRTLVQHAPNGILVFNVDTGLFSEMNEQMSHLLGYTREELGGKSWLDLSAPIQAESRSAESWGKRLEKEALSGGHSVNEWLFVDVDGKEILTELRLTRLPASGRRLIRASVVDIRERKRLEEVERTRVLEQYLERTQQLAALGTLAAGISHEINNPIGAILLGAEYLLRHGQDVDKEVTQKIQEDARRCGSIVKSLLQFAREEEYEKSLCDINDLILELVDTRRESAERKTVDVEVELDPDLPRLKANPTAFGQVLHNLITNAVQASPRKGKVRIATEPGNDCVRILVRDEGEGLNEEQKRRVFDPFFTTRLEEGGTGLGLSIVHGIIAQHGGTIDLQSAPGQGTTVVLSLPHN